MVGSNFRKIIIFSSIMFPKINVEKPWFSLVPTHPSRFFSFYYFFSSFLRNRIRLAILCFNLSCHKCVPPHSKSWSPWFSQGPGEGLGWELSIGSIGSSWLQLPFTEKGKLSLWRLEITHIISTQENPYFSPFIDFLHIGSVLQTWHLCL